jgi:glycosyltransferase involved in cell wall biosynthesis
MDATEGDGAGKLRIAQVAPLHESVPPRFYGGTERIVSYLTEELVRQGHEVTLFASGDSKTSAELVAPCAHALRLSHSEDPIPHHLVMLEQVQRRAREFDLVHFHVDYLHYPVTRRERTKSVTTLHGRLDSEDLVGLYHEFDDIPVVSISDAQRLPLPWIDWRATVLHGLPADLYRLDDAPEDYLAFLGRVSPEKGLDRAIEIAGRFGLPLRVAAKVGQGDRAYFESTIAPLLRHADVEMLGEIGEHEKQAFLGKARALLFPIDWPEPFGLVMIESMACGTPVIAFRHGAVPEIIDDGESGFVVDDVASAVRALGSLPGLSRARCRRLFEERFTAARMAREYVDIYQREIARGHDGGQPRSAAGLCDPRDHVARG